MIGCCLEYRRGTTTYSVTATDALCELYPSVWIVCTTPPPALAAAAICYSVYPASTIQRRVREMRETPDSSSTPPVQTKNFFWYIQQHAVIKRFGSRHKYIEQQTNQTHTTSHSDRQKLRGRRGGGGGSKNDKTESNNKTEKMVR